MTITENPPLPQPIRRQMKKRAPLSFSQESMWFLQQLDPESTVYNSNRLIKFTGGIDRVAMERALNALIRRHEPLRTFYPNEGGRPVQAVQSFKPLTLTYVDYSDFTDEKKYEAIYKYVSDHGFQAYNLQHGPIVVSALLHLASNEDVLFFGTHHICSDAWSREVYTSELLQVYDSYRVGKEPVLSDLPIQYTDYALWQREWLSGDTLATFTEHWKKILSGDLPILDLPTSRSRPILQTFHGTRYRFPFSQALTSQLKSFCQRERITLFHLCMAAFANLLMVYTGQEDIIMGCPFANRSHHELNNLVGLFVNTLPIRLNLSGNPSVRDLLKQAREVMLDAFAWQAAPFEALVSEISPERDLSRTPVFQVAINMRNVSKQQQASIEGLEMENLLIEDIPAPFDISLEFDDVGGSFVASFLYNADLFDEKTIIHMAAHYQNLLAEFLLKTDRPISELEMLTSSERKRIVMDWNENRMDFPQVCIHDLIAEQSKKNPDAIAVTCNGKSLTYAEIDKKANQLAHYLKNMGVQAGSRIGVYLPRSENSIVMLLAILKAGAAFIPLDLTHPSERIAYVVNDADPLIIITTSTLKSQLPDNIQRIFLDTESSLIDACEPHAPVSGTNNESSIYMIYTSGSTGRPKGVVNVHKGLVSYLTHMKNKFRFCPSDSIVQLTSLSFDISIFEIFETLLCGGRIFLMDDNQMRDPVFIDKEIIEHQVTFISMVPTMLRALCKAAEERELKNNNLRMFFSGGESLLKEDVELLRKAYGESLLVVNQYGPTECTISLTNYIVPIPPINELQSIPIGKPVSNTRAYILDKYLRPVPVGVKGELFIGGIGVGSGYWRQPELTAQRFLPDPFWQDGRMYRTGDIAWYMPDGTICFQGRLDHQIKIRGYRVELGEIESAIKDFPGIKDAVVNFWQREGTEVLAAYITITVKDQEKKKKGLREYLASRLPVYMVPSALIVLKEIPLTSSGKVDRRALPEPEDEEKQSRYLAPRNNTENHLVAIWEEVLGIKKIGVTDNFFELGGHSLLAVRVFSLIEKEFGASLPLTLLFKEGTIEALALSLINTKNASLKNGVVPIKPEGIERPIFILSANMSMRKLALALAENRPIYALHPYENGQQVFRDSIEETAKVYYKCLTDFDPQGPYLLLGHSANGLYALELARLLRKEGKKVEFLGLLDTYPPGPVPRVNQIDRMKFHLNNLRKNNLSQNIKYLVRSAQRETKRWRQTVVDFKTIKLRIHKEIKGDQHLLFMMYKPELYDGEVVLFSVNSRTSYLRFDPMEQWSTIISGSFERIVVDGDHISLLEPPQVNQLAEKILAVLKRHETG